MNKYSYRKFFIYSILGLSLFAGTLVVLGEEYAELLLGNIVTALLFATWAIYFYVLSIKRLQNAGRSSWLVLIGVIPLVNVYLLYILLFEEVSEKKPLQRAINANIS